MNANARLDAELAEMIAHLRNVTETLDAIERILDQLPVHRKPALDTPAPALDTPALSGN